MPRNSVSRHAVTHMNLFASHQERRKADPPLRQIPWSEGLHMVNSGKCEWAYGEDEEIKGIRFIERQRPAAPSPCMLTFDVMRSVSGEGIAGPNAADTWKYTEAEASMRNKFKVWPLIGDTKAVCVRPRISEKDRLEAEALLGIRREAPLVSEVS